MKFALALLLAGATSLPAQTVQDENAAPILPFFDAVPLCKDGEVVGVQIETNVPAAVVVRWPSNFCRGRST